MLKIFLSYSKHDKKLAGKLKEYFEEYSALKCFVAHDDITPGSKWEQEILNELDHSDFFIPLNTKNIQASFWCQQEAGIAIAKKIKIIPFIPDDNGIDPLGFYSRYQGFKVKIADLRYSVKLWCRKEGIISDEMVEEVEKQKMIFKKSNTWAEATINTRNLLRLNNHLLPSDIKEIAEITLENNQIYGSFDAMKLLRTFFARNSNYLSKNLLEKLID